jgi:[acyl-carrier-protein] S-malonyltransferase
VNDALQTLTAPPAADERTMLVFPGQGAQYVGMGRRAHDASARARRLFARADDVLGHALSRMCFDGPAEDLLATRWQQPAILTCSLATVAAWDELAPAEAGALEVVCVAGHSLGEYSALVYADALSFEEAVRLAYLRGSLMQEAAERRPGGMAAVLGGGAAHLDEVCTEAMADLGDGEVVVVANHNCAGQVVLSGTRGALQRAGELALRRGARRIMPLPVAGAFHSPLMAEAARELAAALAGSAIGTARLPVLANSTAQPIRDAAEVRAELQRQVTAPVLWTETVLRAVEMGVTRCLDAGPGETLANLARRISTSLRTMSLDKHVGGAPHSRAEASSAQQHRA